MRFGQGRIILHPDNTVRVVDWASLKLEGFLMFRFIVFYTSNIALTSSGFKTIEECGREFDVVLGLTHSTGGHIEEWVDGPGWVLHIDISNS